jgi:hypothetical protein
MQAMMAEKQQESKSQKFIEMEKINNKMEKMLKTNVEGAICGD